MSITQRAPDVFSAYVHLTDSDGASHAYGPGDPIPGWALPLVGEHVIHRTPSTDLTDSPPTDTPAPAVVDPDLHLFAPPISGPGSNGPAWRAYAQALGIDVHPHWSRAQIITACRSRRRS